MATNRGISLDEIAKSNMFGDRRPRGEAPVTLLPDPPAARRRYAIVSVDDHLLEPADLFEGRVPAKFADAAPRVLERPDGGLCWLVDGVEKEISMGNVVVGRPLEEWSLAPIRYEEVRKGTWDVHERIRDMDLAGVWGSLAFPSIAWGFAGQAFSRMTDPDAGLACLRAYNDWLVEEWTGTYPDRLIPSQLPWFRDVDQATAEVLRNAERGVHGISFTENPDMLGYPSIHSGYWDKFFATCEETGTVLNLHVGSASWTPVPSSDSPGEVVGTLFEVTSLVAATDWLWSMVPLRFPNVRIVLSEGGIGWVPLLLDRLRHMSRYHHAFHRWPADAPEPAEILLRNFRFCSLDDPIMWKVLDDIGRDNVMVEVDYPHLDSSWPRSQDLLYDHIGHLDVDVIRKVTYENACGLYQLTPPPNGWAENVAPAGGWGG